MSKNRTSFLHRFKDPEIKHKMNEEAKKREISLNTLYNRIINEYFVKKEMFILTIVFISISMVLGIIGTLPMLDHMNTDIFSFIYMNLIAVITTFYVFSDTNSDLLKVSAFTLSFTFASVFDLFFILNLLQ